MDWILFLSDKKSTYCLLSHLSDLHLHMDDSRVQRGAFLASSVVNPGMVVTFPGYCSLANLGMCLCWQVPYLCQQASSPSTEKKHKKLLVPPNKIQGVGIWPMIIIRQLFFHRNWFGLIGACQKLGAISENRVLLKWK